MVDVGYDSIIVAGLSQVDWFRDLLEEVDDRRAAEPKGLCIYPLFQHRQRLVEEEDNLELSWKTALAGLPPAAQVHEQKLLRKRKELGKKSIAEERLPGIGQQTFFALETDREDALLRRKQH